MLSLSVDDSTLGQVVRGKLDANLVARHDPDEVFSHPAGHMSHHLSASFKLDAEARVCQCLRDSALDFEGFFFRSQNQSSVQIALDGENTSPSTSSMFERVALICPARLTVRTTSLVASINCADRTAGAGRCFPYRCVATHRCLLQPWLRFDADAWQGLTLAELDAAACTPEAWLLTFLHP